MKIAKLLFVLGLFVSLAGLSAFAGPQAHAASFPDHQKHASSSTLRLSLSPARVAPLVRPNASCGAVSVTTSDSSGNVTISLSANGADAPVIIWFTTANWNTSGANGSVSGYGDTLSFTAPSGTVVAINGDSNWTLSDGTSCGAFWSAWANS